MGPVGDVDVVRPVPEVQHLVELLLVPPLGCAHSGVREAPPALGRVDALRATGGQDARQTERPRAHARIAEQIAPGYSGLRETSPQRRVDVREVARLR